MVRLFAKAQRQVDRAADGIDMLMARFKLAMDVRILVMEGVEDSRWKMLSP